MKYNILLVDDERTIREYLPDILNVVPYGFQIVAVAANGLEAIETIKQMKIDVILLDIRMPKMDGIEFLHFLRSHGYL